jgi:hypothetical protein
MDIEETKSGELMFYGKFAVESYSQIAERSTGKANNGQLNNGTRVRRTCKHGSQCEGKKHG